MTARSMWNNADKPLMPKVWGYGQLLAFSGLDGQTAVSRNLVLHTGRRAGDLLVRLPILLELSFLELETFETHMLLGDCCEASTAKGRYALAFRDHQTLVGVLPEGAEMRVGKRMIDGPQRVGEDEGGAALYATCRDGKWALWCRPFEQEAGNLEEAATLLKENVESIADHRRKYVAGVSLPTGLTAADEPLYRKAVSVQKVNVEAPDGVFKRRWTTPDRWLHRHMWLWDSAFHALALVHHNPALAQDALEAVLERQCDDGMIPHMMLSDGSHSQITQPPVLAWAMLYVLEHGGEKSWARRLLPGLRAYLDFDFIRRDTNENGIPEWETEANELCRSGESGLDNSPRFDKGTRLDAVDFASWLANDYECLAELAEQAGEPETASHGRLRRESLGEAVRTLLWCEDEGFFFDRELDGMFVPVKAISGFMPIFAGIADDHQAACLRDHLENPKTFGTPLPCPSVSLDSGTFSKDMWRGPVWINMVYMVYAGLRRYGFEGAAERLRDKVLKAIRKWYEREGCLFEFYDAMDLTNPHELDRKQRFLLGRGYAPISDYGWTAAMVLLLLRETPCEKVSRETFSHGVQEGEVE